MTTDGRSAGGYNNIGWFPLGWASNVHAVRINKFDVCIELCEFGKVDCAVFIRPIVDERSALASGCDEPMNGRLSMLIPGDSGAWSLSLAAWSTDFCR